MKKVAIKPGERYHHLTTIKKSEERIRDRPTWVCLCDCGQECLAQAKALKNGNKKSCGCLNKEKRIENLGGSGSSNISYKHGKYESLTYKRWIGMKRRCTHKPSYQTVEICDRWVNSFENFLVDMGECPSEEYTIDRINNSLGYEPNNCRWATSKEQARNRNTNRLVEGVPFAQYCEEREVSVSLAHTRIRSNTPKVKQNAFNKIEKPLWNETNRKNRKLSDDQVREIRSLVKEGDKSLSSIARDYLVSWHTIKKLSNCETYKDVQ